jgi:hypothetical protein
MKFSDFLRKQLKNQLEMRRIVVWYDAEGVFKEFAATFEAPNCEVLFTEPSVLKARRRADEVYRGMVESGEPRKAGKTMLIYCRQRRGTSEDEKMLDPFEVFALAGDAFGDEEGERLESLAKQAMPEKAAEITRLFAEGRPTIQLLDDLESTAGYPVLRLVFGTETPADVVAQALCKPLKAIMVDETKGAFAELMRLFERTVGFKKPEKVTKWGDVREKAAEYVLFSEFAASAAGDVPTALSAVPRAEGAVLDVINAAGERMRADDTLRDCYVDYAGRIERDLKLYELTPADSDFGGKLVFPFQDRVLLKRAMKYAVSGDVDAAKSILQVRAKSIWRYNDERTLLWTIAERGLRLQESISRVSTQLNGPKTLTALLDAYAAGGWADPDRDHRLFEAALAACPDSEELGSHVDFLRTRYRELFAGIQERLFALVATEGWPPAKTPRQSQVFDQYVAPYLERRVRTAYFLVDSLRYEMGRDLAAALGGLGEVVCHAATSVLPTTTEFGMAALLPKVEGLLNAVDKDGDILAAVGQRLLKTSQDRLSYFKELYGDRTADTSLDDLLSKGKKHLGRFKNTELLVVRTQDPDQIGELLGGVRARRYLTDVIGDIAAGVRFVVGAGFKRVVIASDHGHIVLPEILPGDVIEKTAGDWRYMKRRCLMGAALAEGKGAVNIKTTQLGIQGAVADISFPIGFKVFSAGEGYCHGGLSLQEAVVPVVVLNAEVKEAAAADGGKIEILYARDRFTSRVIGLKIAYLKSDLFETPLKVRVEAYDPSGQRVGDAADCEARDETTGEITLLPNKEVQVPVLIDADFQGAEVVIRVSDPRTRVILETKTLKNSMME